VTFEEFEQRARADWERIPERYRSGVDGLVVHRSAQPHPSLPDVYTLGECVTESYPSAFGDADTIRSVVVLHYGSFFRLSRLDPEFDWEDELWETLTHELQHHLESLADDDRLGDMDYAADENFRRYQGETFDPYFYREGLPEDGWYRVEQEYFREVEAPAAGGIEFEWSDVRYTVAVPETAADVTFLTVIGGVEDPPAGLHLVRLAPRPPGLFGTLRQLLGKRAPTVAELDVNAVRSGS
jgi:hypothetical protein